MKRGIILLVLVLMVVTSLNAGTLAIYTSTVDVAVLDVSAKRFVLGLERGGQVELNLKVAPGERVSYNFEVTNTDSEDRISEVDMDMQIQGDFTAVSSAIPGLEIELLQYGSDGYTPVATVGSDGLLDYTQYSLFTASLSQVERFSLTFYWPDEDDARALLYTSRVTVPITVYVQGVQHVS